MDLLIIYAIGGLSILIFVTLIWLVSLIIKNAAVMDIFWGIGLILTSQVYSFLLPGSSLAQNLILSLVLLWGIRLSVYIAVRAWGKPEDPRYLAWRQENGKRWWWYSYIKVFLIQGLVMWVVSAVLLFAQIHSDATTISPFIYAGIALFIIGFIIESLADCQMLVFKRKAENNGKVLASGIWKWSRHPNYFGEAVVWWGFGLFAVAAGFWWTLLSPLIMNFFLVKVSGVVMLDRLMLDTKPQYRDYIKRTSGFIPMPPRKVNT